MQKKLLKILVLIMSISIFANILIINVYAEKTMGPLTNNQVENSWPYGISEDSPSKATNDRNNIDVASILSLLGIGLLKFVDDKLKIKWRGKFTTYKKFLLTVTIFFSALEAAIIGCLLFNFGPSEFGNFKNVFLGLIPIIFCILTWITINNENDLDKEISVYNQNDLEYRINEFTASGMSPLGIVVGDMDFLGKVYPDQEPSKKDDIRCSSQLDALAKNQIREINIVCKKPTTDEEKRRIGYLRDRFKRIITIKFYKTTNDIPQIRGRIMYKNNSQVVVITRKIKKYSEYEYIEYPVTSIPGGLFADLWKTIWQSSVKEAKLLSECDALYKTYMSK